MYTRKVSGEVEMKSEKKVKLELVTRSALAVAFPTPHIAALLLHISALSQKLCCLSHNTMDSFSLICVMCYAPSEGLHKNVNIFHTLQQCGDWNSILFLVFLLLLLYFSGS